MPCYSEHVCDHSECVEKIDSLTRMLCAVMSAHDSCEAGRNPQFLVDEINNIPNLRGWWIAHKAIDERRRVAETETERQREAERKHIEETNKAFTAYIKNKLKK